MSNNTKKLVTRWLILATVAIWLVWDVFVWMYGVQATISEQIGGWIAYSAWIALLFGLVCGHLIASMPPGTNGELNRWLMAFAGFLLGVYCTRMI